MINTYSGEKIDAREGDVVFTTLKSKSVWRLLEALEDGYFKALELEDSDEPEVILEPPFNDLVLLHRPFQVGDTIHRVTYHLNEVEEIVQDEKDLARILKFPCKHKDPSLRDHQDYEGKK